MKFFFTLLCAVLTTNVLAQDASKVTKYKDDFGLICTTIESSNNRPSTSKKIILYSPKNGVTHIGYRQSMVFKRDSSCSNFYSISRTPEKIVLEPGCILPTRYSIDRKTLLTTVSYSVTDSTGTRDRTYYMDCELMSDEDFKESIAFDVEQNPRPQPTTPSPLQKNKL